MKRFLMIMMVLCMVMSVPGVNVFGADDDDEGKWQVEALMLTERSSSVSCAVGDKIYIIGGGNLKVHLNNVDIYDTNTGAWSSGAPMPEKIYRMSASVVERKIYVMGGSAGGKNVYIYDIETNTWSSGAPMPTARYNLTTATVGDKIFAIGGRTNEVNALGVVEIYDTKTDQWSSGVSMLTARSGLVSIAVGTDIYAIGGIDGEESNKVEIYSAETNAWRSGKNLPKGKYCFASSLVGSKIYTMGGISGDENPTDKVYIYDIVTDAWAIGPALLEKRLYCGSIAIGDKIYIIGGQNGSNILNTIESLNVASLSPNKTLAVLLRPTETVQLSVSHNLADNADLTWTSAAESIATVDENGKVTAVAEGLTYISATNADGTFKESIPVRVTAKADELRLAVHLSTGQKQKLHLVDDPSTVTWSSMDETIATVNAAGQVTAAGKGLAIIKGEHEGESYQIYVRVNV